MNFVYLLVAFVNLAAGSSKQTEKEKKDPRRFLTKHQPCSRKRLDYPNGKSRKLSRAVAETAGLFETVDIDGDVIAPKKRIQSCVKWVANEYPQLPLAIASSSSNRTNQQSQLPHTITSSSSNFNGQQDVCVASTSTSSASRVQQEREEVERALTSSPDIFLDADFASSFLDTEFPNTQKVLDGMDVLESLLKNSPSEPQDPLYIPEVPAVPQVKLNSCAKILPSEPQGPLYIPEVPIVPQVASTQKTKRADDKFSTGNYSLVDIRKLEISKFKEITCSLEKKEDDLTLKLALLQSELDQVKLKKQNCIEETKRLEYSLQFLEAMGDL